MVDSAAVAHETCDRRCPACQGGAITPANHLLAINDQETKVTKEEYRCAACGTAFWVVRTEEANGRSRSN